MKNLNSISRTILTISAFFVVHFTSAQFYLKLRGGYNMPAGRTEIYSWGNGDIFDPLSGITTLTDIFEDQNGTILTIKNLKGTYGQGGNFGLEAGYMFTKYVGAALEGSITLSEDKRAAINVTGVSNYSNNVSAKLITLTPSIILDARRKTLSPYLSLGPTFGFSRIKEEVSGNVAGTDIAYSGEVYGGVAFGLSAGLGGRYVISSSLSVFAEFKFTSLQYNPKYREVTAYTESGKDKLADQFPEAKAQLGEETVIDTVTGTAKPATHPLPFSSANLSAGIVYAFGQK